jgi:hypothetical protein
MSISSATNRRASPLRVLPREAVGVLLLALGLVVAIAISSATSTTGPVSPHSRPIRATQSHPRLAPLPVGISVVPQAKTASSRR